jgi:hypothetical protein
MAVLTARQRLLDKLTPQKGKTEYIKYNLEWARVSFNNDYWSPTLIFNNQQFET